MRLSKTVRIVQARRHWKQKPARSGPADLYHASVVKTNLTRLHGTTACLMLKGTTNADVFRARVRKVLVLTLRPSDIVAMDNLSAHKAVPALDLIEKAEAQERFLPAYSPDPNPIDMM
jgi:hypothetical protein